MTMKRALVVEIMASWPLFLSFYTQGCMEGHDAKQDEDSLALLS